MIKVAVLGGKSFKEKADMFKWLKANEKAIILERKSQSKRKTLTNVLGFLDLETETIKGIPNMDADYIYPIITNTNYKDSHKDVHLDGSMTKTAKEQDGKVYYLADHSLTMDGIIATPKNVDVMLETLTWKDLGRNYEGETEALIYKVKKDEIMHEKFLKLIEKGEPLQNSIRMQYVKIEFAFNSEDKEYVKEKKVWDEVSPKVVNLEGDDDDYFFAVKELKLHLEGSAVLFGSNDSTPIKVTQAEKSLEEIEAEKSLREKEEQENLEKLFYNNINI